MIQFRLVLSRVTQASINSATRLSMRLRDPFQVMIHETPYVTTLFSPLTAPAISPIVTLHTVTIGLPSTTTRKAYTLIHALILDSRSRVVSLGFHCNPSFTIKDIAAVCSALPYAHTLRSVEFYTCVRFGEDARQDVLSWIHYAWTHPRVVNQIGSLRRCFVQGSLQSFESLRLDPLAWNSLDLEPKTVWEDENILPINRNMRIDPHRIDILDRVFNAETERSGWVRSFWYSTGTTAATTKPTMCFETPPTGSKARRRTIPELSQVDVVMKRYDWYAVVVPCRGLWWIPSDKLTLNHPPERARVAKRRRWTIPETPPDDFALSIDCDVRNLVVSLVSLLNGSNLTSLCLSGRLTYDDVASVLETCLAYENYHCMALRLVRKLLSTRTEMETVA